MFDKQWKVVTFFSGIIVVVILFIRLNNWIKEVGSWADWFSAVGSIAAIIAVWWQSRQEKILLKLQLENEKEQAFQQRRQLFKLNIARLGRNRGNGYLPILGSNSSFVLHEIMKSDDLVAQVDVVEISNISDKDLIAVHVVFVYANTQTVKFNIDSIESHSKIKLINYLKNNLYTEFWNIVDSEAPEYRDDSRLSFILNDIWKNHMQFFDFDDRTNKKVEIEGWDNLSEKLDNLFKNPSLPEINKRKQIIVYYMTSMREKIRLVFEQKDDGIFHQKSFNMLEHKDGWITKKGQEKFELFDKEYNLNNFQESKTF